MKKKIIEENDTFGLELHYEDGFLVDFIFYTKEYGLAQDFLMYNKETDDFGDEHLDAEDRIFVRNNFVLSYKNDFSYPEVVNEESYIEECLTDLYEFFGGMF